MNEEKVRNSWAEIGNQISREKKYGRLVRLRTRHSHKRADQFLERLGDLDGLAQPDVTRRVRSVIEGDANTYSGAFSRASDAKDRLREERATLSTALIGDKQKYEAELGRRDEYLARKKTWEARATKCRIPGRDGSPSTLYLLVGLVIVAEAVILRRPIEDMVRDIFPGQQSVALPALFLIAGLVALATGAVVIAGREWKHFHIEREWARAAAAEGEAKDRVVRETRAQLATLVAVCLQVVLFVLRFQVDTSDTNSRRSFILVSFLLMIMAVGIGLIEYRLHEEALPIELDYDDHFIAQYLATEKRVYKDIPRLLRKAEVDRLSARKAELHERQRHASLLGEMVVTAVNDLIEEVDKEIANLEPLDEL